MSLFYFLLSYKEVLVNISAIFFIKETMREILESPRQNRQRFYKVDNWNITQMTKNIFKKTENIMYKKAEN